MAFLVRWCTKWGWKKYDFLFFQNDLSYMVKAVGRDPINATFGGSPSAAVPQDLSRTAVSSQCLPSFQLSLKQR